MSLNYKSHWKRPPRIRRSSSNSAAADPDLHARKEKRLHIADPEMIQVSRSDAPKTSEFAYFKKFKKDRGGATSSRSLNNTSENLNTGQANGLDFESTVAAKGFEDLSRNIRASFQAESQVPADQSLFHTPPRIDVDNYFVGNRKDEPHEIKHRSVRFSANTSNGSRDMFPSPLAGVATKVSGNQSAADGIFSTKRKKLRQCIAESFKDVEGLNVNSKGFDLISTLLSRLLPPKDETKCYQHSKSTERMIGAVDRPPAFPEPYNFEKSCTVFASASDSGSLWDDVLPAPWSYRPKHKDLPEWGMIASSFRQTKYDFEADLLDYEGDRLHGFDHENSVKFLCADNDDSSFTQSHEKLHSNDLRLGEYDDFYNPHEPSRKKSCNLLPSLDDEDDKENSPTVLRNVGYHQIVHETLDEACPAQLSLWPRWSMEYPDFHSTGYMHEPWNIHKEDYAIEVAEQFPQHLPSPPRFLTWEEDSDTPKDLNDSLTDFSRGMPDDLKYGLNGLYRDMPNDLNYSLTYPSPDTFDDLKFGLNDYQDTRSDLSYSMIDISPDTPSDLSYSLTDLSCVVRDRSQCTSSMSCNESDFVTACFSRRLNTDVARECLPMIDLFSNYSSNQRIFHFPWKEEQMSSASDTNEIRLNDCQEKCLPSSYDALDSLDWSSANARLLDYPCRVRDEGEYCLNDDYI